MKRSIEVRNNAYKFIKWDELKTYDCNSLKEASNRDISKLKNAIVNSKFSFPFYVWKRYIVDGAGRIKALDELYREGYTIPELPIIEIEAENEREAKKLVLQASSQHGEISQESFDLFIQDLELTELELSELNFDLEDLKIEGDKDQSEKTNEYSQKIETPIYTPSDEKPKLEDLIDRSKVIELEKLIQDSKLPKEEKTFLIHASSRFTVFNYAKIADYYAHSEGEAKELMEKLALVIIDYDKAIENGFVELSTKLEEMRMNESEQEDD